jgi:sugar lactone lactonase YvrE
MFDPATATDRVVLVCPGIGFVALGRHSDLLLGVDREVRNWRFVRDWPQCLATLDADEGCVVNDCGCDPLGRLWVGSIRLDHGKLVKGGHLHRISGDSGQRIVDTSLVNGIGWSPDGRTIYVADSLQRTLYGYAYDPSTGTLERDTRTEFVTADRFGSSMPDGLCVDEDGGVWVAHNATEDASAGRHGRVVRYVDGKPKLTVEVPDVREVTSCAFGGDDRGTLYITTMRDPDERRASPNGGALFMASLDYTGLEIQPADLGSDAQGLGRDDVGFPR